MFKSAICTVVPVSAQHQRVESVVLPVAIANVQLVKIVFSWKIVINFAEIHWALQLLVLSAALLHLTKNARGMNNATPLISA